MNRKIDSVGAINLVLEIIRRAVLDTRRKSLTIGFKRSAVKFLNSKDCQFYCECLGIDYTKMIKEMRREKKCQM